MGGVEGGTGGPLGSAFLHHVFPLPTEQNEQRQKVEETGREIKAGPWPCPIPWTGFILTGGSEGGCWSILSLCWHPDPASAPAQLSSTPPSSESCSCCVFSPAPSLATSWTGASRTAWMIRPRAPCVRVLPPEIPGDPQGKPRQLLPLPPGLGKSIPRHFPKRSETALPCLADRETGWRRLGLFGIRMPLVEGWEGARHFASLESLAGEFLRVPHGQTKMLRPGVYHRVTNLRPHSRLLNQCPKAYTPKLV